MLGCQEAGLRWAQQYGMLPAPGAVTAFLGAPVLPSLHWECAIFFHPILLSPAWLHFVFRWQMPTAFLPVLLGHLGKDGLVRNILSQVRVSSRCCDIVTNTQALVTECVTGCISVSDISSVMTLVPSQGLLAQLWASNRIYCELNIIISKMGSLV